VRVVSNAGGLNPAACAAKLREEIARRGLPLSVGVVEGDDLSTRGWAGAEEMFSGARFPEGVAPASANAYLGAFPIAAALDAGADIVITGRIADSAATLGACIWRFGWGAGDLDRLAAGSLAGHILECGPQATGGNFTDWEEAGPIAEIGYPIAEVEPDGGFRVTKPEGTGGLVSAATVAEQMLYEIGDPRGYVLPDVVCDFSEVRIEPCEGGVRVAGATGRAPTGRLKVSLTYPDGWRAGFVLPFNGRAARAKAEAFAAAGLSRARAKLRAMNAPDYDETCVEVAGGRPGESPYEEVALKTAVRHRDPRAVGLFLKETMGAGLATPPGLHGFTGAGRPKPSPVVRLFSTLVDAAEAPARIGVEGEAVPFEPPAPPPPGPAPAPHAPPATEGSPDAARPLEALAWARSGDKGDKANVGVIARRPEFLPWIWAALTDEAIRAAIPMAKGRIERFHLPGTASMNLLLHEALGGGGVASLLNDAQGKGYAQRLLALDVPIPAAIAPEVGS
ncbi:MAG: acyclic terpene utilization AtuA family protein, partial [Pseudomonadota bacterium]